MAHITKKNGNRIEQTIKEHCRKTAQYAENSLIKVGFKKLGYLAGLLHDQGKYSHSFQEYLEACYREEPVARGSVNHTFAGVIYMMERYHQDLNSPYERMTCEILCYAIGSHHGVFDAVDLESNSGFEHRLKEDKEKLEYFQVVERFHTYCASEDEINTLFQEATDEVHKFFDSVKCSLKEEQLAMSKCNFLLGMLARLILSAVINGDRLDTAEFMNDISIEHHVMTDELWEKQLAFMEDKIMKFNRSTPLNQLRSLISEQCLNFADRGDGIYRICVPTGAGKTLATLRYALALAKQTKKKRIMFIIPLLSVIDQNSQIIHEYIKDESLILEHHSNVTQTYQGEVLDKYELLTETWDAPIIISTLYQLLMSLFSNQTTAIRRMQSLSNSIIILDEAQSLPYKSTYLFNIAVNFLATYCNTTVLLCSATQPCFDKVKVGLKFSPRPDMVELSSEQQAVFQRTVIRNKISPEGMSIEELALFNISLLEETHSVLTICNTKKTARELYKQMKILNSSENFVLFHLSTSMCTRHRLDTLKMIRECLDARCKMVCVATQLVEAGIDFSFESVIRVYAGMDNIVQAAGRCNRSFEYGKSCNVYLVKVKDENLSNLKEIQLAQSCTQNLLLAYQENPERFQNDLLSKESLDFYYEGLFKHLEQNNTFYYPVKTSDREERLFDLLSSNKKYNERPEYSGNYYLKQAFKTAGGLFTVFDNQTTDVLVPYNEEAKEIIADLHSQKAHYDLTFVKECLRKAKQYSIQIWDYQKDKLFEDGLIYSEEGGHFLVLQSQCYNRETGLDDENYMF